MSIYNKVETEYPLLDEIVYNCKKIMKTLILKDKREADKNETLESLKQSDIYMAIQEKRCKLSMFEIGYADFINSGIPKSIVQECGLDYNKLTSEHQTMLFDYMKNTFLSKYVEYNPYYRKLLGIPPIGDPGLFLTEDDVKDLYIDFDLTIPLHKYGKTQIEMLVFYGVMDKIIAKYPDKYYIKYINKYLNLYNIRKANHLSYLYIDEACESTVIKLFKDMLNKNRVYFLKTMDTDAYRLYNTYYDRILMLLIAAQSFNDVVCSIPDIYIKRNVFDIRTCQLFFESNGIKFFKEIPIKYQKRLIQNLNNLIKYKSTYKNIVDICSLFGFKNIKLFKYYLMKEHKLNEDGNYVEIDEDHPDNTYELKFIKVPIDGDIDDYYKDNSNHINYTDMISSDKYWNGPYNEDEIRKKILKQEFNIIQSKYMSIDTVYSLTEISFQMAYFNNMLLHSGIDSSAITLTIPYINSSNTVNLKNVFIYLMALMYEYTEFEDNIIAEPSQYLTIKGFNFKANMTELSQYVKDKGYTLEELGAAGFIIPKSGFLTFGQMMNIFINNKNIYNHLKKVMHKADNKNIYDCYKKIYDSLMVTKMNNDDYFIPELGRIATSYTEYLKYNSAVIYSQLMNIKAMDHGEEKSEYIAELIGNITSFTLEWMNTDDLEFVFYQFTINDSGDKIKEYMKNIINEFRSYKITISDLQNIYKLDKDYIFVVDSAMRISTYTKNDMVTLYDHPSKVDVSFNMSQDISVEDDIKNIFRSYFKHYFDEITVNDIITNIFNTFTKNDLITLHDKIKKKVILLGNVDSLDLKDAINALVQSFTKEDKCKIMDSIVNIKGSRKFKDKFLISDSMNRNTKRDLYQRIVFYDIFESIISSIKLSEKIPTSDKCKITYFTAE